MDIDTGKIIFSHQEHTAAIVYVVFNEKHNELISVSKDSTVRVTALSGDHGRMVHLVDGVCNAACVTKGKAHLLIATDDCTVLILRIVQEGEYELEATVQLEQSATCIACPSHLHHEQRVAKETDDAPGVLFQHDMDHAAFGFNDGSVMLYDLVCDTPIWHVTPHAKEVYDLTFSHDGAMIATASRDKTACIISADRGGNGGTEMHRCERHTEHVRAVAFGDFDQLLTGPWIGEGDVAVEGVGEGWGGKGRGVEAKRFCER